MTGNSGPASWTVAITDGFSDAYDVEQAVFASAGMPVNVRYLRVKTAAEVVANCTDIDIIIKGWIDLPRSALEQLPRSRQSSAVALASIWLTSRVQQISGSSSATRPHTVLTKCQTRRWC